MDILLGALRRKKQKKKKKGTKKKRNQKQRKEKKTKWKTENGLRERNNGKNSSGFANQSLPLDFCLFYHFPLATS
jgi:hypothetical protein